jgi:predicted secreted Zn-dependent protease
MPRILRLTLLPLLLLAAVAAGRAEPTVTETVEYYDVAGSDARAVRQDLNRVGPVSSVDGRRYDATARWHVSWRYRYKQSAGSCGIASVTTAVAATIKFPRLKTDQATPDDLKQAFAAYSDKLMLHEKGHVQNAIDIAKRIEAGIAALPPEPTCAALAAVANKLAHALIKEANQMDIEYDRRTQHGRTQGVRFP